MLLDEIKKQMFAAMKAGRTVEKEVLRVAVGEITTAAARGDGTFSDEDARGILRKLVKTDQETIALTEDSARRADLEQEIVVLRALLPQTLGADEIAAALAPVLDAIRAAKNDGQATGVAMKHLKAAGAVVDGKGVTQAVAKLRA